MPVNYEDVINLVSTLAAEKNLRVTVTESIRGGIIAGIATVVGGVLLGPIGLAAGGAIGGIFAATTSRHFKPVVQVLLELPPAKKQELAMQVQGVLANVHYTDAAMLATLVMGSSDLQMQILFTLKNYLQSQMQMHIED